MTSLPLNKGPSGSRQINYHANDKTSGCAVINVLHHKTGSLFYHSYTFQILGFTFFLCETEFVHYRKPVIVFQMRKYCTLVSRSTASSTVLQFVDIIMSYAEILCLAVSQVIFFNTVCAAPLPTCINT